MVGDRLSTDTAFAHKTGMISALVLTGETDRSMLENVAAGDRPQVVLEHVGDLLMQPLPQEPRVTHPPIADGEYSS